MARLTFDTETGARTLCFTILLFNHLKFQMLFCSMEAMALSASLRKPCALIVHVNCEEPVVGSAYHKVYIAASRLII